MLAQSKDTPIQSSQLIRVIQWGLAIDIMTGASYFLGWILLQWIQLLLMSLTLLMTMLPLLVAMSLARRHTRFAALLISISLIANVLATALLLPDTGNVTVQLMLIGLTVSLPYLTARGMYIFSAVIIVFTLISTVLSRFIQLFNPLPKYIFDSINITVTPIVMSIVVLLLWQFYSSLTRLLHQSETANAALQKMQTELETQVSERTSDLRQALSELELRSADQARQYQELEQQRAVIRELSVPILPINTRTLVMPLIGVLDQERIEDMQQRALTEIERQHATHLVLDITGVSLIDHIAAQGIIHTVQAAQLLGVEVILVGIRPEVAQTIVSLGIDLNLIKTSASLQTALQMSGVIAYSTRNGVSER